ncbi:MAG: sigma-70 family RNA polymerase sigma factor [Planctomycetes bacterium]|nr:sigma-70 family RNA polymerase sigma factor [Planctomycetota bacterium]
MTPEQQFLAFRDRADIAALAAVFDALAPELVLVAAHLAGREAEDLVQATFLTAIEKAERWDASRRLLPWLIGILVQHARADRRQRRRQVDPARLPARAEPDPFAAAAGGELADQLAAGLERLPRPLRQVVALRLAHGLSPVEIAHALGCPPLTVKTRLQRGMAWLRRVLPAGVGGAVAGLVAVQPGLAAARAAVLARAHAVAPAATAAGAGAAVANTIVGGWLVKKVALVAAAVGLALGAWLPFSSLLQAPVLPPPDGVAAPAITAAVPVTEVEPSGLEAAPVQREAASAAPPATGSAMLEFVWRGLDQPASGLVVGLLTPDGTTSRHTTDRDGRLAFAALPVGDHRLVGRRLAHQLRIDAGHERRERIAVEPSLRLEGLVVDAAMRPIAGAAVFAQYYRDAQDVVPRRIATAGADGMFTTGAETGGWIWAQLPGRAPSKCWSLRDEGAHRVLLVLGDGGGSVHGVVRAATGQPLADARVTIVRLTPRGEFGPPLVLVTDARGAFATDELAHGPHCLAVLAPGHAPAGRSLDVDGSEQHVELQLGAGVALGGRVTTGDGAPLPAKLTVRPAWAGAGAVWVEALRPLFHLCAQTASTDAEGRYRFAHLPPGPVRVEVDAGAAAAPTARDVELTAGEGRCDFALGAVRAIHGRLVDRTEAPIAGFRVQAWPVGGGSVVDATTAADGTFRFEGLAAERYTVEARPPQCLDSVAWAAAADVVPGGELLLRCAWREADAAWIRGVLLQADGAPVAGAATAWLLPAGERERRHCELALDATGAFRLGPLPPGRYQAGVRVPDAAAVVLGTYDLAPRQDLDVGSVRLPATGTLEVRFQFPDGRPARGVEALVADRAGNSGALLPRPDGSYRSPALPAGVYRLLAFAHDGVVAATELVVAPDRATASIVPVAPAPAVTFAFAAAFADAGAAATIVELRVAGVDGTELWAVHAPVTAAERTWCRALPPGAYRCTAHRWPDGAPVTVAFEVPAAAAGLRVDVPAP